jgi:hypothetical protein
MSDLLRGQKPVAQGKAPLTSREIAQLVLELDATITSWRQATYAPRLADAPAPLPIRPSGIELAVLTSLVQTYGRAIVEDQRFLPVLDFLAEWGAVVLVQRVLWDEQFEDLWLEKQLHDARLAFEILCGAWPEVFMGQANAALTALGLPTLAPPMFRDLPRTPCGGKGDDAQG